MPTFEELCPYRKGDPVEIQLANSRWHAAVFERASSPYYMVYYHKWNTIGGMLPVHVRSGYDVDLLMDRGL